MAKEIYWADKLAKKIIKERGKKRKYVCAAGITPSGTVHIGNFREIITVDLVARALKDAGKKVRFIYSWDDYDRLRKIPKNLPKQNLLKKYLGQPIVDTPDPFECHNSYAEHLEKELERELPKVGVKPEFIYQNEMYSKCAYAVEIKTCLQAKEKIRKILNKFRKEPLPKDWYPAKAYCKKCKTDETKITNYDGKYSVTYKCKCGATETVDFRKSGNVKLAWRVDWPMRWHYENVDFEPGGKEHSTPGGSRDTAKLIIKKIYDEKAPVYQMYDFVIIKGLGGKMSSSIGKVITLGDTLKIYLPEIVRYLFASTKPVKEFSIATDEEVFKVFEDFYK
ncbi:lysine--tRNA ligase, partial [Candidatus Woesearchaeota archaeon]|nr:lysine--tRNA ligase [Candidatus Woesearchaeota archaeon]